MRTVRFSSLLALAALCASVLPAFADTEATKETGQARVTPWSGYWWPIRRGGITQPLGKYDQITGRRAAAWEQQQRPAGPEVPAWFGFCHAWAASAIMEPEPGKVRQASLRDRPPIQLAVGDQKGMLAACHSRDVANAYGDRFGDGHGSEDPQDLAPDVLWKLLKLYVQQQKVALVLDVEAGPEVWNFPVYAYEISYRPEGGAGEYSAALSLLMADDGVPPDYVGCKVRRQTYRFTFRMQGASVLMGSGRWVGNSVKDHPDFAWSPYLAVAENPEVKYPEVQQILGGSPSPEEPPRPDPPRPEPPRPEPPRPEPPRPEPPRPEPPQPEPPRVDPTPPQPTVPPTAAEPAVAPPSAPDHTAAQAAQPISPMELVALIAEKTSSFGLDATVDRFDGGRYQAGEAFSIRVSPEKPGYLYLLHIDSQGALSLLYPLPGQDNRIGTQKPLIVPGPGDPFAFRTAAPPGTNRVKILVTSRPLALTGLLPLSQQQEADGAAAVQGQDNVRQQFRWHPTQRLQIRELLRQYQERNSLQPKQVDNIDPRTLLGPFAQDEVAFYVEPPK